MKNSIATDLEFFVLVARHRSLTATAKALGLTPPAVTKRLALMESRLDVRLVHRTTRSFSLTSEGETLFAKATHVLEDIREIEETITASRSLPRGLLRVNVTLGFRRTTIAPLVSEFAKHYPDVEVLLEVTDRPVDLVENGFDLAIRFGPLPDKRLNARRVMSNRRFLCASPLYLERHGVPTRLADFVKHRCIIHRQNDDAYGV